MRAFPCATRKRPGITPGLPPLQLLTFVLAVVMVVVTVMMASLCRQYSTGKHCDCDDCEKNIAELHGNPLSAKSWIGTKSILSLRCSLPSLNPASGKSFPHLQSCSYLGSGFNDALFREWTVTVRKINHHIVTLDSHWKYANSFIQRVLRDTGLRVEGPRVPWTDHKFTL